MSQFINDIDMIFDFLLDILSDVWILFTTNYLLMLVLAVWIIYKVMKLYKLF